MPPAFLNHRAPTACGTPAVAAASSLTKPAEIAAQNLLICSRFAIVGRPGDRKAARPERSDCRFHLFIAALSRRCDDHLNSLWTARAVLLAPEQAAEIAVGRWDHTEPLKNALLKQSSDARAGLVCVAVGAGFQIVSKLIEEFFS
jgi:hypothetical protein